MDGKVVILEGNEEDEKIKREVRTDHPGKILREILKDYKARLFPDYRRFTGGWWDIFHMITSNMGNHH